MTIVTRSSTISQPIAMRPCEVSSSPRSVIARSRTTVLATDSASPSTSPPPIPQPRATPSIRPRRVAMTIWMSAPGIAIARTAARSRSEKWIPTPNISRMIPMSASSSAMIDIGDEAGGEGAEHDPGHDVADDRRQSDPLGDEAADEGGHQADSDGRDEYGLVVHGSSRAIGWAQDWRGSVPERRLGLAGQRYPTRRTPGRARV